MADRASFAVAVSALVVSIASAGFSAWSVWMAHENRSDAAEQVAVWITADASAPPTVVDMPALAIVAHGRTITQKGKRQTWDVLVSNTSLSAVVTVSAIGWGEQYSQGEVVDVLDHIQGRLVSVPPLPLTLNPSNVAPFKLITETPIMDVPPSSDHVAFVKVVSTRGRELTGTVPSEP